MRRQLVRVENSIHWPSDFPFEAAANIELDCQKVIVRARRSCTRLTAMQHSIDSLLLLVQIAFSALRITDSSPREEVHLGILEHSSERSNAELDDCDQDCTMDRKVVEEYFQSTGKPNLGQ